MTSTAEALHAPRPAAVEVEQKPNDIERLITGIEQRLTALMATGGTSRERYDGAQRVLTYTWPSFEPGHDWVARRVLHMTAPAGEEWVPSIQVKHINREATDASVMTEYGLNTNQVSQRRPRGGATLSDDDQTDVLHAMRVSLDSHIVESGFEPYFKELVDDSIVRATPEQWAEWGNVITGARAERAAMLERQAERPQTAELRASATTMRRLRMLTAATGRQNHAELGDDDLPYVQTLLGSDSEGRMYYSIHNDTQLQDIAGRAPDLLVVGDEHGTEVYNVSSDGVVSKHIRTDENAMDERVRLYERLGNLSRHLPAAAYEASKADLPLPQRVALFAEGTGANQQAYIRDFVMAETSYRISVIPSQRNYAVYLLNMDNEQDWHILQMSRDISKPMVTLDSSGQSKDTQKVEDLVATSLDLIQEVWAEPKNEYEAALIETAGFLDDANIQYRSIAVDHGTSPVRREATIRGYETFDDYGKPHGDLMLFSVEQAGVLGGNGQPDNPRTLVTVSTVDDRDRQTVTRRVTYELTEDGFEPLDAKGRKGKIARQTNKDFESFARNLLAGKH